MGILSKEALLGASDIVEREVELPSIGGSVKVRSLSAAYSNSVQSDAVELQTDSKGAQVAKVNGAKLTALKILYGLVEPKLDSFDEAMSFASACGPACNKILDKIDEISGIEEDSITKTKATFPGGGAGTVGEAEGASAADGNGGSDLPVRTGVGVEDASGGDV